MVEIGERAIIGPHNLVPAAVVVAIALAVGTAVWRLASITYGLSEVAQKLVVIDERTQEMSAKLDSLRSDRVAMATFQKYTEAFARWSRRLAELNPEVKVPEPPEIVH